MLNSLRCATAIHVCGCLASRYRAAAARAGWLAAAPHTSSVSVGGSWLSQRDVSSSHSSFTPWPPAEGSGEVAGPGRTDTILAEAAPSSAAESAAAAFNAELDVLLGVGLNRTAAAAVQEAWHSGRIKESRKSPFLHGDRRTRTPDLPPKRVLVRVRQLLRAHGAAAAAAAAEAGSASHAASAAQPGVAAGHATPAAATAAGNQPPSLSGGFAAEAAASQETPTGGPAAVATEPAAAAGPAVQLCWGALDIQRVISTEPGLLAAPWQDLASRLTTLLGGIAPVLGKDLAVQFVHKTKTNYLRLLLADPQAAIRNLQARHDVYRDVVGVQPNPVLLASTQSSFTNATVATLRSKLESFVNRWGPETAHVILSSQPHLLSSKTSSIDRNTVKLQQLLGCTQQQLQRIASKAPRALSSGTKLVTGNMGELVTLLTPLGLTREDVRRLVLKMPLLLVLNPVTTATKLEALTVLMGPYAHRVRSTVKQCPSLIAYNPSSMQQMAASLQKVLDCGRRDIGHLLATTPSVFTYAPDMLVERLQQLAQVLDLSVQEVKDLCRREPTLLSIRPQTHNMKLEAWATSLQLEKRDVVDAILAYPHIMAYNVEALSQHMRVLQTLVARSRLWSSRLHLRSAPRSVLRAHNTAAAQHAPACQDASSDQLQAACSGREAYWAFMRETKTALKQEYPKLSATELGSLARDHWKKHKQLLRKTWQVKAHPQQQAVKLPPERQDSARRISFASHLPAALAAFKAANPDVTHEQARSIVTQQYYEERQLHAEAQLRLLQQSQQVTRRRGNSSVAWPLRYSRNASGRLLLRLEYLLATGRQEEIALATACSRSEKNWVADFPDYPSWVQLRLQHLQQEPSDWPAALVKRAVAAYDLCPQHDGSMSTAADVARQLSRAGVAAAAARAADSPTPRGRRSRRSGPAPRQRPSNESVPSRAIYCRASTISLDSSVSIMQGMPHNITATY